MLAEGCGGGVFRPVNHTKRLHPLQSEWAASAAPNVSVFHNRSLLSWSEFFCPGLLISPGVSGANKRLSRDASKRHCRCKRAVIPPTPLRTQPYCIPFLTPPSPCIPPNTRPTPSSSLPSSSKLPSDVAHYPLLASRPGHAFPHVPPPLFPSKGFPSPPIPLLLVHPHFLAAEAGHEHCE